MSAFVEGVRDMLPVEVAERKWLYQRFREVFGQSGYREIVTPTLESLELYAGTETFFLKERMFKVVDETGQILVLKPDVTMPIARLAATQYVEIPKPWKLSYISTAYLANGGKSGQMKEKTQAGVEMMGLGGYLADVEVIGLLIKILQKVGITNPLIDIGWANLVEEIFTNLKLEAEAKRELRYLIEEKNIQQIQAQMVNWDLLSSEREIITRLPELFGDPEEVLKGLKELNLGCRARAVVREMEEIYQCLQQMGLDQYIVFDPVMVTNLGYYTGIIFKAYVPGYAEVIASGGRYDGLTQRFGHAEPAVGFAIEVERLLGCLCQFKIGHVKKADGILCVISEQNEFVSGYRLSQILDSRGVQVELYTGAEWEEYAKFHQINYIVHWSETGLQVRDMKLRKRVDFLGDLAELAQKVIDYMGRAER